MADTEAPCTIEMFQAADGYRWKYRRYLPTGQSRGQIVCLHGIQSHGGWYTHSCAQLAQAGFQVDFLDRRGSGLNDEARGDAPNFRRMLDDVGEYIQHLRKQAPALPVFLLAISWGGKLAVALQKRHPGLTNGLILLCPGLFSQVRTSVLQKLRIAWARLVSPRRRFPIPLNDPELFTATPRWLEFLRDDPLALHDATARLLIESIRLDLYLLRCASQVRASTLLLLAEQDRIIDNPAVRRYVESFATTDKKIIEYPGAQHTLEFEPEPERFLADLRQWLAAHLPG